MCNACPGLRMHLSLAARTPRILHTSRSPRSETLESDRLRATIGPVFEQQSCSLRWAVLLGGFPSPLTASMTSSSVMLRERFWSESSAPTAGLENARYGYFAGT